MTEMTEQTSQHAGQQAARDFSSHQLREARAEAVSLSAKNERLVAALTAARERIAELGAQLDAVTLPPVTLGLLTSVPSAPRPAAASQQDAQERSREVGVNLSGRHMHLGVHPCLEDKDLQVGRIVAVNDQLLVVDTLPAPQTGETLTLDEVLDATRVLATSASGSERVLTTVSSCS